MVVTPSAKEKVVSTTLAGVSPAFFVKVLRQGDPGTPQVVDSLGDHGNDLHVKEDYPVACPLK